MKYLKIFAVGGLILLGVIGGIVLLKKITSLSLTSVTIPEINLRVYFPADYSIEKTETSGGFLAYDLRPTQYGLEKPTIEELQFYSMDSINRFEADVAANEGPPYEGNYPTTSEAKAEKEILSQGQNGAIRYFNGRGFLVESTRVHGDIGYLRSYVTFLNKDVRMGVSIWVLNDDEKWSNDADTLFSKVKFEEAD